MIPIYICDDSEEELYHLERVISKIIITEELIDEVEIICTTSDPLKVIDVLKADMRAGIFFLDVDLGRDAINGVVLGANIRAHSPGAFIVIVTAHPESAVTTYKYKIGAGDFILKDDINQMELRIRECILHGRELILSTKKEPPIALFKKDGSIYTMYINQMYYIEVMPEVKRKLRIYERYGITEVISTISEIASKLDNTFFQCHKSYIINLRYIESIDIKKRIVNMKIGHKIPISFRCLTKLQKAYMYYLSSEVK